jgi:hypothetical protein
MSLLLRPSSASRKRVLGEFGRDDALTDAQLADRGRELFARLILQQITTDPGIHGAPQIPRPSERRHDEHTACKACVANALREVESREPGHLDVGHQDVRHEALDLTPGLETVGRTMP